MRFPNLGYSSKSFEQIYRAQYGTAMLVYIRGTSGTYFGYLGDLLSGLNKQAFTKALSQILKLLNGLQNHEIGICDKRVTHRHNSEIQNVSLVWEVKNNNNNNNDIDNDNNNNNNNKQTTTTTNAKENRLKRLEADITILTHFTC